MEGTNRTYVGVVTRGSRAEKADSNLRMISAACVDVTERTLILRRRRVEREKLVLRILLKRRRAEREKHSS